MGFWEKYAAFQWLRNDKPSGGGPPGDLALVAGILLLLFGATYAIIRAVGFTVEVVYTTVRPVLLTAPNAAAITLGVGFAVILLLPGGYPRETAETILTNGDGQSIGWFAFKSFFFVGLMNGFVYVMLLSERIAKEYPEADGIDVLFSIPPLIPTGSAGLDALQEMGFMFFFSYLILYKLYHLPYRFYRLVAVPPYGRLLALICLLPMTVPLAAYAFALPGYFDYVNEYVMVNGTLISSLVLILFYVAPYILAEQSDTGQANETGNNT